MPTYEYVCDACEHKFEEFQSITSEPLKKCPACKKSKLRRLFGTGAAIVFKGSGFYQTDYRSESYKKRAEQDSKGASESSSGKGSDSSKSDTGSTSSSKSESSGKPDSSKSTTGKKSSKKD